MCMMIQCALEKVNKELKKMDTFCPEATVIPVWKTPVCKRGVCKRGILKHPVFNVLNFRGWIKRIFDTVD